MPNYVTNYLKLSGDPKVVEAYWPQAKEIARTKLQADPARCNSTISDASFKELLNEDGSRLLCWDTRWVPTKGMALTSFDPIPGLRIDFFWGDSDACSPHPCPIFGSYTDYTNYLNWDLQDQDEAIAAEVSDAGEMYESEDDTADGPDDFIQLDWGDNPYLLGLSGE